MAQENRQIVLKFYEAANNRDFAALAEVLDKEIEIHQTELLPWGGSYQGHQGFMIYAFKMLASIDSQAKLENLLEAGNRVVAKGKTQGRVKSSGQAFEMDFVHVWTIKNEKLSRFEIYIDTPQMLSILL